MGKVKQKPRQRTVQLCIPESLCKFVDDWSKATGENKNDIAQSLFSHGLAHLCATNDWKLELVDRVAPILEDLCACSGEGAEILYIDLERTAVPSPGNGKRN